MLFAETRGKLGRDGSRAHDRAEDLLTSTAFQLLRYLPFAEGLGAVLGRVRPVAADGTAGAGLPTWLNLNGATDAKYEFWPHWGEFGQPDVVVELLADGRALGRVVVEVKLDAGKSGGPGEQPDEAEEETVDPDQLVRYWQGLQKRHPDSALGVVYLTAHAVPPADELSESLTRAPEARLGWLSWRDVWAAVRANAVLPAQDLAEILAAKGLKGFDGFHAKLITVPASGRFWVAAQHRWFSAVVPLNPADGGFWSSTKGKQ